MCSTASCPASIANVLSRRVIILKNMGDKNLVLVKTIERFPCLYNYNLSDYSKKELTDRAWNEVANETKLSVGECKEKWKNLRYGFIRSLKPNADGSVKKKYYLHDDMEFVLPFVKPLSKQFGLVQTPIENDTDDEYLDNQVESGQSPQQHYLESDMQQNLEPPRKKIRLQYENNAKILHQKHCPAERFDESRKMFLLSLLPEINELTESQMRAFRRKVLSLIDEIVDTPNLCDTNIFQWAKEQHEEKHRFGNDQIKSEPL
ncbi:uncharacterized protein LOC113510811 [Galleria mellonella]|uniref:Uncharacterized protein LOC113510811 n=1 Tax=Galleria mellonella TaxID=7137 RepID=A0A6J1WI46_GALME|nr:uncharacterized protein LOC113510811 [Galleria mellonella]